MKSKPNIRKTGLVIKVHSSIHSINKTEWNRLGKGFFDYGWFKTVEDSVSLKIIPRHIVVYKDREIVAIAPCFIEHEALYATLEEHIFWRLRRGYRFFGFGLRPALVCRLPILAQSRIFFKDNNFEKEVLDLILDKMNEICESEKISVFGFPYVSVHNPLFRELEIRGYMKLSAPPSTYLDVNWDSFEDYIKGIRNNKMRNKIRKQIKKNKIDNVTISEIPNYGVLSKELLQLFNNTYSKYNNKLSPLTSNFFETLNKNMADKIVPIIAEKNKKIIGFNMFLKGKEWYMFFPGQDYELTKSNFTYFNITFYYPIKTAIEENVSRIQYGMSTYKPKIDRGCSLESIYIFVKSPKLKIRVLLRLHFFVLTVKRNLVSLALKARDGQKQSSNK
jgi:predicted N-acyltransferase